MADSAPLSWTPVRRGITYCAPACGRGCTIMEHDSAAIAAHELVEALGPPWKSRVMENLGWHWYAYVGEPGAASRGMQVWPSINRNRRPPVLEGYHAYYSHWSSGPQKTPAAAVQAVLDAARGEIERLNALLAEITEAVG